MATKFLNGIDSTGQRIINVQNPSQPQDAATKDYVDQVIRGLDWKQSVRAASTGPVTLSAPGVVDGVTLAEGDRVLLKNQAAAAENGIYILTGGQLVRAEDANNAPAGEVTAGMAVTSTEGTENGDVSWVLVTDDPIVLGTTELTFSQLGGSGGVTYTASLGVYLAGSDFRAQCKPNGGILVDPLGLYLDPVALTGVFARKYASDVPAGTSVTITHDLGTTDVQTTVYAKSGGEVVYPDVLNATATTITLGFASNPTAGTYRAVVVG